MGLDCIRIIFIRRKLDPAQQEMTDVLLIVRFYIARAIIRRFELTLY